MNKDENCHAVVVLKDAHYIISKIYTPCFFRRNFIMSNEDVIKIYESVQSVLAECCLTNVQQLKQIKEVRAIYQADLDSRPLGHSVSIGMIGVVVALFAAACSLVGGGTHSSTLINYIEYIILGMLIIGSFVISSSTCKQKLRSTIVSAIDDTLEAVRVR